MITEEEVVEEEVAEESPVSEEEVIEEVDGLGSGDREYLRKAAQNDLYVLSKGVLGYKDVNVKTHGSFCRFFQSHESIRRLGLMPRAHLKSTIGTIADSIRLVLANPDEARVLIVGETATTAEKFLFEIKGHFQNSRLLKSLFPELIPERFSGPGATWSQTMASVRRTTSYKDPSWQAIGVGGAVTGGHFSRIKCDDLIGFDAARSPAKMKEAIDWVNNIEPLLIDQHCDIIDWIGTRWSRRDLYAHIMTSYLDELAVFTRQAIESGEIIFPEKHTWKEYERIQRISPAVWFAQYCNNPMAAGQTDFPAVRPFRFSTDGQEVIFRDSHNREKRWKIFEHLDRVICADPNSGSVVANDLAAIAVVGVSPDDETFSLDMWSGRVSPSAFVDTIYSKTKRWKPRVVGIEKAGQQNTQHYFELKAAKERMWIRIVPLEPRNKDKETRIRTSMEPIIRSGLMYVLPTQNIIREQLASFPDCILFDELDALAYHTQISKKPIRPQANDEQAKIVKMILAKRSHRTGY